MPSFLIVADNFLLVGNERREFNSASVRSVTDLAQIGRAADVRQVWILPGTKLFKRAKRQHLSFFKKNDPAWTVRPPRMRNLITAWENNPNSYYEIIFPGFANKPGARTQWALDDVSDAETLSACIRVLKKILIMNPSIPIKCGRELLQRTAPRDYLRFNEADYKPFAENKVSGLEYKRELTDDERACKWLHVIDKRRAYLSAYDVAVGVGNYHEITEGEFNRNTAGLWRATLYGNIHRAPYLPNSREFKTEVEKGRWFYTPMLAVAEDEGFRIEIHQAFIFDKSARIFEKFYKTIREGIKDIENSQRLNSDVKKISSSCLKSIFHQFYSWLAHPTEKQTKLFRPDWRGMIVSQAKARVVRNIKKGYELGLSAPAGVRVDSLFYFSDEPDYRNAIPNYLINEERGQYRIKYSIEAKHAFKLFDSNYSISKIDDALYLLAGRK